ncbi:NB-ARC domain-containing protein [Streptomyces olivaceoviridis]
MLVLAATGQQAEALDVYRTVCTRLADELLQCAQRRVLGPARVLRAGMRSDSAGAAGPDAGDAGPTDASRSQSGAAVTSRPAQLPSDLPTFTGRRGALARLRQLLAPVGDRGPTAGISVIGGMAGVGKTALAVHWAHRVADRFPDGRLYVNLRGFHPTGSVMSPAEAIRSFIEALGVSGQAVPAGLDAQAALYRSLLAERRVLIVPDNARDTEQVRPLLPGAPGCLVPVTSRSWLYGLVAGEGAHIVTLDPLGEADAVELLSRRLGPGRIAREPGAAARIVASCGRLPLALALVGARAALSPSSLSRPSRRNWRRAATAWTPSPWKPPSRTPEARSPGPISSSARRRPACSASWHSTRGPTARSRPSRASRDSAAVTSGRCWPSWCAPT